MYDCGTDSVTLTILGSSTYLKIDGSLTYDSSTMYLSTALEVSLTYLTGEDSLNDVYCKAPLQLDPCPAAQPKQ